MGVSLELKQLPVADYILSERVGIERKSAQDFNDSIKDGRLFNELIELKNNFVRPVLLLEGDPFINSNIPPVSSSIHSSNFNVPHLR